ncbi:MAG: HAMP domain-containing histidine kinase [Rhodospirillaceae bacterium]|nr:HAMP domain-containing histidine kinase [Rhodospirillaceae bacterium]MBT4487575.1 HAMP domain-containing histidine kinase [Rhodospirillaceae bacterium]MBT5193861.1 HAMP domain-containing histidine kinase [Rhodospirillaceae bacterium]MBT5897437.1 HAMP domain-containing histidine kinase [Rhodospirillaceae bacterium]MBT6427481.1 HAMP domain-containing histidine kinase [Rhodospirillaceae bacterium]
MLPDGLIVRLPPSVRALFRLLGGVVGRNYHHGERNLVAVSVCGVFGMPLYYFVWHDLFPQPYENLTLRLIGGALCIPLAFKDHWPEGMRRFAPILWYGTVLYVLPFFFTYMTLQNDFAPVWLVSFIAALLLLVFLVDWLNLIVLSVFGMLVAWIVFTLGNGQVSDPNVFMELTPVVLFALVVGTVFSYRNETLKQERLDAMLMAGRNLSRELREPLLGIRTSTVSLKRYLPQLLEAHELAENNGLAVREISTGHRRALGNSLERLQQETSHASTIIEMLLRNTGGVPVDPSEFQVVSMAECVETALQRYPFASEVERKIVKVKMTRDFGFLGSDSGMVHVVLSLLKIALSSVAKYGKGEVLIELATSPGDCELRIRDSSAGPPPGRLANLFDEFSLLESDSGTGPALAQAKKLVEAFAGAIAIRSERGQFTEYVIILPPASESGAVV